MTSEERLLLYYKVVEVRQELEVEKKRMLKRSEVVSLSTIDKARIDFLDRVMRKVRGIEKEMEK